MKTLEGRGTFIVKLMFHRLDKFNGLIFRRGGWASIRGYELIFGMLIELHI